MTQPQQPPRKHHVGPVGDHTREQLEELGRGLFDKITGSGEPDSETSTDQAGPPSTTEQAGQPE